MICEARTLGNSSNVVLRAGYLSMRTAENAPYKWIYLLSYLRYKKKKMMMMKNKNKNKNDKKRRLRKKEEEEEEEKDKKEKEKKNTKVHIIIRTQRESFCTLLCRQS